jgi:hypothetical protein
LCLRARRLVQSVSVLADIATDYSRLEETAFRRDRLRRLTAFVIGAGALGNEVVKALGLLGIGRLLVADPDAIEPSNLTRSVLFRDGALTGSNKALALAHAAGRIFPDTEVIGFGREIADIGFQTVSSAGLLFSCVDSELARLEISYIAAKLDLPVCDAGLGAANYAHGRISYFPGRRAACYCCCLSARKRSELLTMWTSPVRSCAALPDPGARPYPSTPTMAAIVGSLQVEIGLRRLFDRASAAETVEISVDPSPRLESFRLPLSGVCPFHTVEPHLVPEPEPGAATVHELLERAEGGEAGTAVLLLDWPLCVRARCEECGESWAPMQRIAAFRRRARCPGCRSGNVVETETISRIGRDSPWARLSPAKLGLPERHLHTIRFEGGA